MENGVSAKPKYCLINSVSILNQPFLTSLTLTETSACVRRLPRLKRLFKSHDDGHFLRLKPLQNSFQKQKSICYMVAFLPTSRPI
ncbi:MAG: hypothetical protein IJM09_01050, partial [Neisseriaceae bacterium]|nr:hypothetical protein [Neisseriaceae bacterium]